MVDFALESGGECPTPRSRPGVGAWEIANGPRGSGVLLRLGVCWSGPAPRERAVGAARRHAAAEPQNY